MELEASLQCSQESTGGAYPESHESSPHASYFFMIHFNITSHPTLGLLSGLIPLGFLTEVFNAYLVPCVLHAPPIFSFLI